MKIYFSLRKEISQLSVLNKVKESKANLLTVFVLVLLLLGATIIASIHFEIPYSDFMRDPVVLLGGELYMGWFSQLGVVLWSIASGFCFLSAKLVSNDHPIPMLKSFLLFSFFLTTFLGADDIFMFHDEIFPLWGVHENIFTAVYLILVSFYIIIYYKVIFKTEYVLLVLAFSFFAFSIFLDKIPHKIKTQFPGGLESIIYEDGSKMIGILLWMVYFYSIGKIVLIRK